MLTFRIRVLALTFTSVLLSGAAFGSDAAKEARFLRNIRQLTFVGSKSGEAYFSPDGKSIVFQSVREPGNPFYQIFRMDLSDGIAHRVSTGKGHTTCSYYHPTKKRILFASSHLDPDVDAKQTAEIEKLKAGPPPRYQWDFDPFLDIFESDYDGGNLVRLTDAKGYDAECAYSPDGSKVVFCSFRDGDGEIYSMDSDGKNQTRLTHEKGYDGGPFFSPDGKKIVWRHFDDEAQKSAEVWTMDADGSNKKQLTELKAISWAPFWHPSMKWLIFASNFEDPAFELYAIRPDGSEQTRITYSEGFDGLPAISPDGKTLMWTSNRSENKSQVFMADLYMPDEKPGADDAPPANSILGGPFVERLRTLNEALAANNTDHQVGHIFLDTGIKPLGKFEELDETSFIQGPAVVGWRPPVNGDDSVVAIDAAIDSNESSSFETAVLVEAAVRLGQKTDKPRSGVYLAAAYPDELRNIADSAAKALKAETITPAPHLAALISLNGLSKVRDRRVVVRGVATGAGWREAMERLAARHPEVQLVLEDDPTDAPGLVQKTPVEVTCIAFGAPKEPEHGSVEAGDPAQDRACRERAAAVALDCIQMLADHEIKIAYQAYDPAKAKAVASASSRPYLGTVPEYNTANLSGVRLTGVREGSPAQKAGLKTGDVITELDGKPVTSPETYLKALETVKIDAETTIKIQRDGKEQALPITPTVRH